MKKTMRNLATAFCLAIFASTVNAAIVHAYSRQDNPSKGIYSIEAYLGCTPATSDMELEPGKWYTNFWACKNYCDKNGIPLMAVFSNEGCDFCWKLDKLFLEPTFGTWYKTSSNAKIIYCFISNGERDSSGNLLPDQKGSSAHLWMRTTKTGVVLNNFPYVALYWKQNGVVKANEHMTGSAFRGGSTSVKGANNVIAQIENAFKGWVYNPIPKYVGALKFDSEDGRELYFSHQDTATGAYVPLPLTREHGGATNQSFVVSYPDSTIQPVTNSFDWAKDVKTSKIYPLISREAYVPGKTAKIDLLGGENEVLSSVIITFVEPPYLGGKVATETLNAPPNVKTGTLTLTRKATELFSQQIVYSYKVYDETAGEAVVKTKTIDVQWEEGETEKKIDIDFSDAGAAQRVAGEDKVQISIKDGDEVAQSVNVEFIDEDLPNGVLNPYFVGEKTSSELNWGDWTMDITAATNKVTDAGEGQVLYVALGALWCGDCKNAKANLFETDEFKNWAKEKKVILVAIDIPKTDVPSILSPVPNDKGENGAEYLFRKNISAEDASAVIERNKKFCADHADFDWAKLTQRTRVPVPTFIKLGSDGKVAGRFSNFGAKIDKNDSSPTEFKPGYLNRLDEVLACADGEDADSYLTTPLSIDLGGNIAGKISSADRYDVIRIEAKSTGDAFFELKGPAGGAAKVEISLWTKSDVITTNNMIASATGVLDENGVSLTYSNIAMGNYYLRIKGDSTGGFELDKEGDSNVAWSLMTSKILIPAETQASDSAIDGRIVMRLAKDTLYRIEGLDVTGLEDTGLVAQDEEKKGPFFLATKTGDIPLPTYYADGAVNFQIWNPGNISFKESEMTVFEFSGRGTLTVGRSGGSSGSVYVNVNKLTEAMEVPGRYVWPEDAALIWNDGEVGEKTIEFIVNDDKIFEPQETFEIELVCEKFTKEYGTFGTKKMVITVSDTAEPCFTAPSYEMDLPLNFAFKETTNVYNVDKAKTVSLVRKSGKLPSGITLKYDRAGGTIIISGTPTKAGEYEAVYYVRQGTKNGIETAFKFNVFSPSVSGGTSGAGDVIPLNANIGKALNAVIPLISNEKLVGELNVSVTTKNKISAKYRGDADSTVAFSGSWQGLDVESGECSAVLKGTKGAVMTLSLSSDGIFTASLSGVANGMVSDGKALGGSAKIRDVAKNAYAAFKGYYTLTIPVENADEENPSNTGTGYMSLNFTSSTALKNGVATYSGRYANGTTFSGSVSFIPSDIADGKLQIPFFVRSKKDLLSSLLYICPDAESKCSSAEELQVIGSTGISLNRHVEKGFEYLNEVKVYGGYYTKNLSPIDIWELHYTEFTPEKTFDLFLNGEKIAVATARETMFALSDLSVNKFTFKFAKSTGILSGSVRFIDGDEVITGTWYGILMPGWTACGACGDTEAVERPCASGTLYYTKKVNGKSYKHSISVDMNYTPSDDDELLQ